MDMVYLLGADLPAVAAAVERFEGSERSAALLSFALSCVGSPIRTQRAGSTGQPACELCVRPVAPGETYLARRGRSLRKRAHVRCVAEWLAGRSWGRVERLGRCEPSVEAVEAAERLLVAMADVMDPARCDHYMPSLIAGNEQNCRYCGKTEGDHEREGATADGA